MLELGQTAALIHAGRDADRWWAASAGLITRILTLTETIVHVGRLKRRSDLATLTRSLFEHVVMLAWIAAPRDNSRFETWERASYRTVGIVSDELEGLGLGFLTDAGRDFVREQSGRRHELPPVPKLAETVDAEWQQRLGLAGVNRLVAKYTYVYRLGSMYAHPTAAGLFGNRERVLDGELFLIEQRTDIREVIGPVFTLLAVALVVASHTIGRPPLPAIKTIVGQFADATAQPS